MEDKLQLFYNSLTANPNIKGLPGDYDLFRTTLADPGKSELFYNSLKANRNIKGLPESYDEFVTGLALNSGGITPKEPEQERPGFLEGLNKKFASSIYGAGEGITEAPQFGEAVKQLGVKTLADAYINRLVKKGKITAEQAEAEKKRTDTYLPKIDWVGAPHKAGTELPGTKMADSKANKWLSETSDRLSKEGTRYDERVVDYLKKGQFGKALGAEVYSITESLAPTLLAAFGGPVGAGALGVMTGAETYDEVKDREDMQEAAKVIDGLSTGVFEALFEYLGTAEMTKMLKNAYAKGTKEQVEEALKGSLGGLLSKAYKRFGVWLAPVHEGLSEGLTTLGQNATAKFTGEDPGRKINDNFIESVLIGMGMGGVFAGTEKGLEKLANKFKATPLDQGPAAIGELKVPYDQEQALEQINKIGRDFKFGDTLLEDDPNPVVSFAMTKLGQKVILKNEGGVNGDNFFIAFDVETSKPVLVKAGDIMERKDVPYQEWVNSELQNYNIVKAQGEKMTAQSEAPVQEGQEITIKDKNFYVSQVTPEGISLNEIDEKGNITGAALQIAPDQYNTVFGLDQGIQEEGNMPQNELPQATNEGIQANQAAPEAQAAPAARTLTVNKTNYQAIPDEKGILTIDQVFTDETTAKNALKALEKGYPKAAFSLQKTEFEDFLTPDEYKITIQPKQAAVKAEQPVVISEAPAIEPTLPQKSDVRPDVPDAKTEDTPSITPDETAPEEVKQKAGEMEKTGKGEPSYAQKKQIVLDHFGGMYEDAAAATPEQIYKQVPEVTPEEARQIHAEIKSEFEAEQKKGPKEPWQMTREEFWNQPDAQRIYGRLEDKDKDAYLSLHKVAIEEALAAGESVPPEVLADYPELQTDLAKVNAEIKNKPKRGSGRMGNGMQLSDEIKQEAGRLYQAGLTQEQVAKELSIGASTMSKILNELGIPARKFESLHNKKPQELKDEVLRLYVDEKIGMVELSERFNIGTTTIGRWLREAGVTRNLSEAFSNAVQQGRKKYKGTNLPWQSTKTNRWEFADSKWEMVRMSQLDADETVKSWTKLVGPVPYTDPNGVQRNYSPDFIIEYHDGRMVVEEIKPSTQLDTDITKAKTEAARQYFNDKGIEYEVITENEIGVDDINNFSIEGFASITEEERNKRRLERRAKAERERSAKKRELQKLQIAIVKANDEVNTLPTEKQVESGNYKKGHLSIPGFDITIENPAMSVRSGTDRTGRKWSQMLNNSYGYFRRTKGKDGDQVDVFLGDNLNSDSVYVIDQVNPETGLFDEHKVMLGFNSAQDARDNYHANYEPGWKGLGAISKMSIDQFKDWLGNGIRTRRPVDGNVPVQKKAGTKPAEFAGDLFAKSEGGKAEPEKPSKPIKEVTLKPKKKGFTFGPNSRTGKVMAQTPNSFREAVLQFFVGGGRIKTQDFLDHTGYKRGGGDFKQFFWVLKNDGVRLDVFHEQLENSFGIEDKGPMDMTNEIIDVLMSYKGDKTEGARSKMIRALEEYQNIDKVPDRMLPPEEDPSLEYDDLQGADEEVNKIVDDIMELPEVKEIVKQYSSDGILDVDKLLAGIEASPGEFTIFPFALKKSELLNLKERLQDEQRRRTQESQTRTDQYNQDQGQGTGENTPRSAQGNTVRAGREETTEPAGRPEVTPENPQKPKSEFVGEILEQGVSKPTSKEYRYKMLARPFDIGTFPKPGFIKSENDPEGGYQILTYDRKLTPEEQRKWEFLPLTEIAEIKGKEFVDKDGYFSRIVLNWFGGDKYAKVSMYDTDGNLADEIPGMKASEILQNVNEGYWTEKTKEGGTKDDQKDKTGLPGEKPAENIRAEAEKLIGEDVVKKLISEGFGFKRGGLHTPELSFEDIGLIDNISRTALYKLKEKNINPVRVLVKKGQEVRKPEPKPLVQPVKKGPDLKTTEGQIANLKYYVEEDLEAQKLTNRIIELRKITDKTPSQAKELREKGYAYETVYARAEELRKNIDNTIIPEEKIAEITKLIKETIAKNQAVGDRILNLQSKRDSKEKELQKRNELLGDRNAEAQKQAGEQSLFAGDALFAPNSENLQSALKPFNDAIKKTEEEWKRNDQLLDEQIDLVLKGTQQKIKYGGPKELEPKESPVASRPTTPIEDQMPLEQDDKPTAIEPENKESLPKLEDFGEKIGGARKDLGITRKVRDTDSLPAWRRKYSYANADGTMIIGQAVDTSKPFIVQWAKEIDSWVGKRTRYSPVTTIDTRETKIFNSEDEAEAYIPIYEVWKQNFRVHKSGDNYVITKKSSTGKAVEYATFPTEEDANVYMYSTEGATSLLNHKREDFSIPALDKVERSGKDWRKGKDISPEEFMNAFGFRGGEFGNWVKPEERRVMLNAAYDSFMDLAALLNIPPKALSFGGELSIAFGARGTKGAAAHFEPDRAVINLTRMNGAGSLAHEWAHALDNYFGLQGAKKDYSRNEKGEVKAGRVMRTEAGLLSIQGMRQQLSTIFDAIVEATQQKAVTRVMGIEEKQKNYDRIKKSVQGEADSLLEKFEKGVRRYQYNRKTKQREEVIVKGTPAQLSKIKGVLDKIIKSEGTKPIWSRIPGSKGMGEYSYISPETLALEELHKEVFGRSGLKRDGSGFYNLGYYADKMFYAKTNLDKALAGESETLNVPTDFLKSSKQFDKSRAIPYWSTKVEMFARAFEYFVETKLLDQNIRADYLQYDKAPVYEAIYGKNPYPSGEERGNLNNLFGKFFETIQTKEEGGKVAVFRIIGEQGAQNVEGLIDNLITAKEMEATKKDAKTIFLATGWQRGKDNLWRYETKDIELKKDIDFISNLKTQNEAYTEEVPITEVVEDEELFNSYPQLKDVKLIFYNYGSHPELTKAGAFTDFKKKVISIGTENLARTKQSGYNFPVRTLQAKSSPLSNFMEARPTYAYNRTSFKSVLSHEIQHYIQRIEDFGEGSTMVAGVQGSRGDMDYWGAVGEVEARNVQRRINYSPEIRRSKMLRDTEDVSRDQQIILRNQIEQQYNTPFRISEDLYFSPVERALGAIKQDKATVQQWKAMLLKNGAKETELAWMGWDDFASIFEGTSDMNKDHIQTWINQNKVEIKEVGYGGEEKYDRYDQLLKDIEKSQEPILRFDALYGDYPYYNITTDKWVYKDEQGNIKDVPEKYMPDVLKWGEAKRALDDYIDDNTNIYGDFEVAGATKYSQYTLPGGEDYKELLLTMPGKPNLKPIDYEVRKIDLGDGEYSYRVYDNRGIIRGRDFETPEAAEDFKNGLEKSFVSEIVDTRDLYQSGHWDQPNILAHVRFNTRRSPDGKNILFIEEIQSDWAQTGKKKGFNGIFDEQRFENWYKDHRHSTDPSWEEYQKLSEVEKKEYRDAFLDELNNMGYVPDMPYKKTDQWAGLALRRMVRYAIDNGYDAIAWTPGEVQNERYDLSKQIDHVMYWAMPDGKYGFSAFQNSDDTTPVLKQNNLNETEIEDYLGKEVAQKIINKENPTNKVGETQYGNLPNANLKVGGSGMKGFYDNILPSIANKLGKKFGSQVDKVEIKTSANEYSNTTDPDKFTTRQEDDGTWTAIWKETGTALSGQYKTKEEAQGAIDKFVQTKQLAVHSLPITEAMFDSYRQGIPLFKSSRSLTGESLLLDVVSASPRENWENEVRDKVSILANTLNTKIEVINNRSQLPGRIQRQALRQGITSNKHISGVYDPQTDTVYVILDEIRTAGTLRAIEEVTKTVLHEVVAHQGLPSVLGEEEYNKLLDDLFWSIPQLDRSFLMEQYNTSNPRTISEEYLGMMAEQDVNPTLFKRMLAKIRQLIRKLFKVNYTENDIHYMLRRSRENLQKPKASDFNTAEEYLEAVDKRKNAKFRIAKAYKDNIVSQAAEVYKEKEARRTIDETKQGIREYIQDLNLPIRKFEEEVLKRGGKQDNESKPYRDTSLSFGRQEKLYNDFFDQKMKPVLAAVANIKKSGASGEEVLPYIICKHAIERNRVFREKELNDFIESHPEAGPDKINDFEMSIRNKDYSGVMAFDREGKYTNPDELAKDIASEFESQVDKKLINDLWSNLREANSEILDTWEAGQQISAEQKQEYLAKFKHFVPLRGWRDGAAKELRYTKGQGFSHSLRHAEGRKSLADNPLAYILNVEFQAIAEQVTNEVNSSMLNLIIRNLGNNEIHELATLKKLYYLKVNLPDGSYEWEPTLTRPTPEQFANDEARTRIFREHERLRAPSQAREHEVIVQKPGGDMVMIFKGKNLSVAQSLNKQNYLYRTIFGNVHDARDINKAMAFLGNLNNMLKAAYTSWNVVFPFTNFMRDFQEASITQAIKQGNGLKVIRNYKHTFPAIIRQMTGRQNLNNPIDRSLDEFYKAGGATGYTHLKTPEEIEKDINKEIKRMVRAGTLRGDMANTAHKFLLGIENWNRIFEDATRFSVYMASLSAGNTKEDAASDAKEASVNFNRKGKGSKAWDAYFAFFNVALQSMQKNFSLAKNYTGKFSAVALSFVTLGFLEAMMNALFDDDEDTSYYNINPYMRQNYLLVPNIPALIKGESKGDKYLSIPLPQFWRGFKSMGAIGFDIATKRMNVKDGIMHALGNFGSSLLPVDIGGLWKAGELSLAPIMPTVIKPIAEVIENRNYMGYAIKNEPFTKEQEKILAHAGLGKKNVSPAAKFITDMLFRWGGGDSKYKFYYDSYDRKSKKVFGLLDINPSTLEHLFKGYTGGTGAGFSDLITTITQGLTPEQDIDFRNMPFVNRFIRKVPEAKWNIISDYYSLRDDNKVTNLLSANYFKEGNYEKAMEIMGDEYLMRYTETFKHYESALDDAKKDVDFDDVEGNYRGIELMRQCINDIKDLKEQYGR